MSKAKLSLIKGNSSLHLNLEELYKTLAPKFAEIPESEKSRLLKHTICTANYASQIAESMKLPPHEIKDLETAALLFDIGKTEIPINILTKEEPLTLEEYWSIQGHPFFSEMLVKPLGVTKEIAIIIKKHHERIDGEGYPGGWKGNEICFSARILSAADSYAAMRSDTPYRKALSKKEAIEELKRGKNKQFDSAVVDEFIKVLDKPRVDFNALLLLPLAKFRQLKNIVPCFQPLQNTAITTGVILTLSFGGGVALSNSEPRIESPFNKITETRLACEMLNMGKEYSAKEDVKNIKALSEETAEEYSAKENIEISTKNISPSANKTLCEEIQTQTQANVQTQSNIQTQVQNQYNKPESPSQNQYNEPQKPDFSPIPTPSIGENKKPSPISPGGNLESVASNSNAVSGKINISEGNSASEGSCASPR